MGSQKSQKNDPGLIFKGLGGGPKNGTPSRAPKSEILQLFTTLELGPTSQKGTPFWSHFGDLFCQKKTEKGVPEKSSKSVPKNVQNGSQTGGGSDFYIFCSTCNTHLFPKGPTLPLERSWTFIFHYFGVPVPAFLCSSTLPGTAFFTSPSQTGGKGKIDFFIPHPPQNGG